MSRIFASLAVLAIVLMAATLVFGLSLEKNALVGGLREAQSRIANIEQSSSSAAPSSNELEAARRDYQQIRSRLDSQRGRSSAHLLLGVAAALGVALVSSIAVTYFIGTSRWCREVVDAYALDRELATASQRLKRRSFPWALLATLTVLAISALGAASDPATGNVHTAVWVMPHLLTALGGVTIVGVCFYCLWTNIDANHVIIDKVVRRVAEIRAARGLKP